jgi:hypothetical protein
VPVTGNATIALFAAVMADCGLLTTVCVIGGTFRTPLEFRGDRQGRRLVQLAVAQPNRAGRRHHRRVGGVSVGHERN